MTKIPVLEGRELPQEGAHEGQVAAVEVREIDYQGSKVQYMDLVIALDGSENEQGEKQTLKVGYPLPMSTNGAAYKLAARFGIAPDSGEEFDTDKIIGMDCTLLVQHEASKKDKDRVYANIIRSSVKPRS